MPLPRIWPQTSSRRGLLAPLKYKKTFQRPGSAPDPAEGAYSAHTDLLAGGEEASFPTPNNPTSAVGRLSLWLRPFGLHPDRKCEAWTLPTRRAGSADARIPCSVQRQDPGIKGVNVKKVKVARTRLPSVGFRSGADPDS